MAVSVHLFSMQIDSTLRSKSDGLLKKFLFIYLFIYLFYIVVFFAIH